MIVNEMKINNIYLKINGNDFNKLSNIKKYIDNLIDFRDENIDKLNIIFELYDIKMKCSHNDYVVIDFMDYFKDKVIYTIIQDPMYLSDILYKYIRKYNANYVIAGIYDHKDLINVTDNKKSMIDDITYKQILLDLNNVDTLLNLKDIVFDIDHNFNNTIIRLYYHYCKNININNCDKEIMDKIEENITTLANTRFYYIFKDIVDGFKEVLNNINPEKEIKCNNFDDTLFLDSSGNVLSCIDSNKSVCELGTISKDSFYDLYNTYSKIKPKSNCMESYCEYSPICRNCEECNSLYSEILYNKIVKAIVSMSIKYEPLDLEV